MFDFSSIDANDAAARRNCMILQWAGAEKELEALKQKEMTMRQAIVAEIFDAKKKAGTETFELGNGWKLKAVKKENISTNSDKAAELEKVLPTQWQGKLFKTKTEITGGGLKELQIAASNPSDETAHAILRSVMDLIEIRPGSPSLELCEPKIKD